MVSENLRPATRDELTESLAFALRFDGRRQFRTSTESMAKMTAEHLVAHLERSGYVLMKRPTSLGHSSGGD
jgi:hypothetical protein